MIKAILLLIILSTSTMAETIPCFTPQEKCLPMILHEMNKAQKKNVSTKLFTISWQDKGKERM